ncbi:hypothetical protein MELA_01375 [Candidatus Methylomirabilis lanthanidiphila]|uniref:Uncharacterized protein n=1 Tax=Candidatus Methylomirabilis lanthanidiphila TaxID=2211376 RepID=A0A564ZI29_9BACT|nr:hypothetical protein MELA_01375 [Candidatus Methylomirabilis lanthanidiphila]
MGEEEGNWSAVVLKTASCAVGDEVVILPDDVKPGNLVECHGIQQRVTYEYGAYALEKV